MRALKARMALLMPALSRSKADVTSKPASCNSAPTALASRAGLGSGVTPLYCELPITSAKRSCATAPIGPAVSVASAKLNIAMNLCMFPSLEQVQPSDVRP